MTQLAIVETGPAPDPTLAQWHTPPDLARALVSLAGGLLDDAGRRGYPLRVLEPSAGRGALARAVLERCPRARLDLVEVDARWRADLEPLGSVTIGSYLERPASPWYDLAVTNPPYDGGEEGAHLAKLLDESQRVVALLPSRSLHGRARYDQVWQRFDPSRTGRDWWLRQVVHCVSRPRFGAKGGTDEIVLLDMRRVPGDCVTRWL